MTSPAPLRDGAARRAFLRQERRSYVIGILVVFSVIEITLGILFYMMHPGYFQPPPATWNDIRTRLNQMAATSPSTEQQMVTNIVQLAGAAGLFLLNWRYSLLLRRPRAAFTPGPSSARWLWWTALFANSLLYTLIFPQLILLGVLVRWGTQEIRRQPADGGMAA